MVTAEFWIWCAVAAVISYLLGSFNFGVIISKAFMKDDVRNHGSGNAGMTNMLRTYGKKAAAFTVAGDFLKALIAVFTARLLFKEAGLPEAVGAYAAGLFVLLGHLYPLYFRFRGGKGAATTLGVILMINPAVFLALTIIFVPLVIKTRLVSLGSVLGAAAFPFFTMAARLIEGRQFLFETCCAALMGAIVLFVHRGNIKRLLSGTENRIGGTKK